LIAEVASLLDPHDSAATARGRGLEIAPYLA
jgi:hypothetical protein